MRLRPRVALGLASAVLLTVSSVAPTAAHGADLFRGPEPAPAAAPPVLLAPVVLQPLAVAPPVVVGAPVVAGAPVVGAPAAGANPAPAPVVVPAGPPPVVVTPGPPATTGIDADGRAAPVPLAPAEPEQPSAPGARPGISGPVGGHTSSDRVRSTAGEPPVAVTVTADALGTAAQRHGWGAPSHVDLFDAGLAQWNVYDGPGTVAVRDGVLTIAGSPTGGTTGAVWNLGATYGRWEARVRAPVGDPGYDAVLLLWPDAEDGPTGGEIDIAEMQDPGRRTVDGFVHRDGATVGGQVRVDATQWHHWAVEWAPAGITLFVDGEQWWSAPDATALPARPMHLCVQLDGSDVSGGAAYLHVDSVAFYPVPAPA